MKLHELKSNDLEVFNQLRNIALLARKKYQIFKKFELNELVNEFYIVYINCLKNFDPSKAQFSTYFFNSIFRNLRTNFYRQEKKNRRQKQLYNVDLSYIQRFYQDDLIKIETYLTNLTEFEKNLVKTYFFVNLTFAELGNKFNMTKETARLKFLKALDRIRKDLDE